MKVDGKLGAGQTAAVIEEARRHEKAGYDGLWSSESAHDPFLPLVLAAEHTERMELGTRSSLPCETSTAGRRPKAVSPANRGR